MVKVGILGATAYTSLELIKILLRHPSAEISYLGSRRPEQPPISSIFPSLLKSCDLPLGPLENAAVPGGTDFLFSCLPHGVAMELLPRFLRNEIRVVDLSADYRFTSPEEYSRWYGVQHKDLANLPHAVYGLPELYGDLVRKARIVGNPGCYPTGAIIPLAPLLKQGICHCDGIVVDSKSGVSGAGRTLTQATHFPECNESVHAYNIGVHRHTGELLTVLSDVASAPVDPVFVPHLVPMDRGILTTAYVILKKDMDDEGILDVLRLFYDGSPFVRVRTDEPIRTKDVLGTNYCDIGCKVLGRKAVLVSAIDNLVKGASGQAVQNMNLMLGLDETEGLI